MIQMVPYAAAPETAEIMSRYRPIAPKPEVPGNSESTLSRSPYLRGIYDYLQERPTRARRRSHASALFPPYIRRNRADCPVPPPYQLHGLSNFPTNGNPQFTANRTGFAEVTLNLEVKPAIISPKPVRPVPSRIIVTHMSDFEIRAAPVTAETAVEVEAVLQAEAAPAIVSDSRNRVRLTNSAYNELIGQPECGWLDCCGGERRIGGEVVMEFRTDSRPAAAACKFQGQIEWESEGEKKRAYAYGNGAKLGNCRDGDFVFFWTFFLN